MLNYNYEKVLEVDNILDEDLKFYIIEYLYKSFLDGSLVVEKEWGKKYYPTLHSEVEKRFSKFEIVKEYNNHTDYYGQSGERKVVVKLKSTGQLYELSVAQDSWEDDNTIVADDFYPVKEKEIKTIIYERC